MTPETLTALLARVCTTHHWRRHADGKISHVRKPLGETDIKRHLNGGPAVGACPIAPGEDVTRCAVLDFDSHKGETPWPAMQDAARRVMAALEGEGIVAHPFRSTGGAGIHLVMLWSEPQGAAAVRAAMGRALATAGLRPGVKGVGAGEVEVFPKQAAVAAGQWGSMFVLPGAGQSVALGPDLEPLAAVSTGDAVVWRGSAAVDTLPAECAPYRQGEGVVGTGDAGGGDQGLSRLREALAMVKNDDLDYDEWRNVVFAIHYESDGSAEGLALAHEFSARSSKYDADFLESRVWPYIRHDRVPVVTGEFLYGRATAAGWVDPRLLDGFEVIQDGAGGADGGEAGVGEGGGVLKFPAVTLDEFTAGERVRWLVKGVLPTGELAVVYGAPKSGKTFFVLDLAMAVARGVEWRGHRVKQGRVVYICAEGSGGFRDRIRAYQSVHGAEGLDMRVIAGAPSFLLADDIRAVVASIRAVGGAALVVVDTLARVIPGGDENSAEDMGNAIRHCQVINKYTGALVLLVHHSGKDATKGMRGSSALLGAVDVEIEVIKGREARAAQITNAKDGTEGEVFGFTLQPVPVGVDEDGDTVTSCTVVQCDIKAVKSVGNAEQKVLDVIDDAHGKILIEDIRKAMPDGDKNKNVRRTLKGLVEKGFVTIDGDFAVTV